MTRQEIDEFRELAKKATPRPWNRRHWLHLSETNLEFAFVATNNIEAALAGCERALELEAVCKRVLDESRIYLVHEAIVGSAECVPDCAACALKAALDKEVKDVDQGRD